MAAPKNRLSQPEFIGLMAMTLATTAFSIDAMLPALPEIAEELSPENPNQVQLIITSFVLGLGLGTFFTGPLSDSIGRRKVVIGGVFLFIIGTTIAWLSNTLEFVLFGRVIMGLGAAGPRVAAVAMTRDLYDGRDMARIMSFIMVVFSLAPALAPTIGHYIILGAGWRSIFIAFGIFAALPALWLYLRQPESLDPKNRRPVRLESMLAATKQMFAHRTARLSIFVQTLTFGMLFTVLSTTQQVFDETFGQGEHFHLWFAVIAVLAATGSLLNARLVGALGMRAMVKGMFIAQIGLTLVMVATATVDAPYWIAFGTYLIWVIGNFFQVGLTIGNLNALAMEEMGHIAGLAASVIAAFSTVGAVMLAAPTALLYDGTPLPMGIATLMMASAALWLTTLIKRPGET
ncbi:MAG: multidrug effflux MFS transporter [Yoonia sp.]|uniref:multidrug effflux MFS transporter n=3 Tax=Yoonia sp. TaxID=2212373 RepID=UPI003263799A